MTSSKFKRATIVQHGNGPQTHRPVTTPGQGARLMSGRSELERENLDLEEGYMDFENIDEVEDE